MSGNQAEECIYLTDRILQLLEQQESELSQALQGSIAGEYQRLTEQEREKLAACRQLLVRYQSLL